MLKNIGPNRLYLAGRGGGGSCRNNMSSGLRIWSN